MSSKLFHTIQVMVDIRDVYWYKSRDYYGLFEDGTKHYVKNPQNVENYLEIGDRLQFNPFIPWKIISYDYNLELFFAIQTGTTVLFPGYVTTYKDCLSIGTRFRMRDIPGFIQDRINQRQKLKEKLKDILPTELTNIITFY